MASGLLSLQYVTYGAARGELQGSLCALLLVLLCIVALLADRSGSIFAFLRIIADSCSLSSLSAWWFGKSSVFSGKYSLRLVSPLNLFSVTVPVSGHSWGGSRFQGCHGYLLSANFIWPPTTLRGTCSQAHY